MIFRVSLMRIVRFSPCLSGFSFAIVTFTFSFVLLVAFPSSFRGGGLLGINTNEQFKFERKVPSKGPGYPPIFAYWISGSNGEKDKVLRLLKAVYHPRNRYLLHLDAGSSHRERSKLAASVQSERIFRAFGNVDVVGKVHSFDRMGSSAIAATLHAAAMLLKINGDWDWFITLSASDYPIVTQDDFLHVFTPLPRNLNFVRLTSYTGWKESQRINQIVIDPNLYMSANTPIFQVKETRATPEAFKVFTGSPWVILSRPFIEYCVHGWDNLPRKLLMYFSNVALPLETYFHTILCNSPYFQNTTVNNDLRYVVWDTPPKLDPQFLDLSHYEEMATSGAAFARRFKEDDPMLLKMDEDILGRRRDGVAPGKWCLGPSVNKSVKSLEEESCSFWGDIDVIEPGDHVEKLRSLVSKLVAERLDANKCNL